MLRTREDLGSGRSVGTAGEGIDQGMDSDFLHRATESRQLEAAWQHVAERDRADGRVAGSIRRFARDADARLRDLSEAVRSGSWRPGPLIPVTLPETDGTTREIMVATAADRVLERALFEQLSPLIEPELSPWSFGYRTGLGVNDALRALVELRDEGWGYVARTDVDDCFPTVPHEVVLAKLARYVDDDTVQVVAALIRRVVSGRAPNRRGVPQGGALSPLLANLVLDELDRLAFAERVPMVRFADDMVLCGRSDTEVRGMLTMISRSLDAWNMRLGAEDTEVTTFDDGFTFLGEEIGPRYPSGDEFTAIDRPIRRTIAVARQGASCRLADGRFIVSAGESDLLDVPRRHVGRIVLFGSVGLSAGVRTWALTESVPTVFLSRRGRWLGQLGSGPGSDVNLVRTYLERVAEPDFGVRVGRGFLAGKLAAQRALLLRHGRGSEQAAEVLGAADEIRDYRRLLSDAGSTAELLGVEGMAARAYWSGFRALLPTETGFLARRKRPPGDVVNAALGYGYAILTGEAATALVIAGLDPALGILHTPGRAKPALALDLLEEFRPIIVDSAIVDLARRGALGPEHSRPDPDRAGVLLTEEGRRRVIAKIEERLLTQFTHPLTKRRCTYRRGILLQANQVSRLLRGNGDPTYEPVRWR